MLWYTLDIKINRTYPNIDDTCNQPVPGEGEYWIRPSIICLECLDINIENMRNILSIHLTSLGSVSHY